MGKKSQSKHPATSSSSSSSSSAGAGAGAATAGAGSSSSSSSSSSSKNRHQPHAASSSASIVTTVPGSEMAQTRAMLDLLTVDIKSVLLLLEKLNKPSNLLTIEELEKALNSLEANYLEIAVKNRLTSKQDEALAQEISSISLKRDESASELLQVREQFYQAESKSDKLEGLSKTLSHRLKSIETKANEDVKFEKEERLKLSYEFSGKIKDISAKLDELSKRRETIVSENLRLRQILKGCLEELDKEDEMEAARQAKSGDSSNATQLETAPGKMEDELPAVFLEEPKKIEIDLLPNERKQMEVEDDISRIVHLKWEEEHLRIKSSQFMEVFDSFQTRLTESNHQFRSKQARVEDLTKDIQKLERCNRESNIHISDCENSAKAMNESIDKIRSEKDRFLRLIEKQRSLIDKFQSEIASIDNR